MQNGNGHQKPHFTRTDREESSNFESVAASKWNFKKKIVEAQRINTYNYRACANIRESRDGQAPYLWLSVSKCTTHSASGGKLILFFFGVFRMPVWRISLLLFCICISITVVKIPYPLFKRSFSSSICESMRNTKTTGEFARKWRSHRSWGEMRAKAIHHSRLLWSCVAWLI